MPRHKWSDLRAEFDAANPDLAAARAERVAELIRENDAAQRSLAELRKARRLTQVEVAERLGVPQPQVSQLENRTEFYLSTLMRYVEALGGRLELTAVFGEQRVSLELAHLTQDDPPANWAQVADRSVAERPEDVAA